MISYLLSVALVCLVALPDHVAAFGAGNIATISALEGKAFRHGDIEDILATLVMSQGAIALLSKKFGALDIKRVYFGEFREKENVLISPIVNENAL